MVFPLRDWLLLVIMSLTIGVLACMAQLPDFNVQLLNERNDIQTAYITRLIRDPQGYLWLLSPRHLQRFDGQTVKRINVTGEDLLDMAADGQGRILVSSQSGVKKYENDRNGFEVIPIEGGADTKFAKIQITPDNRIWLLSGKGLFLYDTLKRHFRQHSIPGLPNPQLYRRIFQRAGARLFFTNMHTLFVYDTDVCRLRQIPFSEPNKIALVSPTLLWMTNNQAQTFEVDIVRGTVRPVSGMQLYSLSTASFAEANKIIPLDAHTLLISCQKGLFNYNRDTHTFSRVVLYHMGNLLACDEIYTDLYDSDGTLWLLSEQGIVFFNPAEPTIGWLRNYSRAGKKWVNNIQSVTEDNSGNLWLGTIAGFAGLNLKSGQLDRYPAYVRSYFRSPSVQSIHFDGTNLLLGPATGGPLMFNSSTQTVRKPVYPAGEAGRQLQRQVEEDLLYTIYPLASGNHLILADLGCYLLEKQTYRIQKLTFRGADFILQSAFQDRRGNLWIGSYKGLLSLTDRFATQGVDPFFSNTNTVRAIAGKNDSTVYAGAVGLFEVQRSGGKLSRKPIVPELRNQQISVLYRDRIGNLWIGADDGLYRYNEKTQKIEWFDVWDNVQNKKLHANSVLAAQNGVVYIGGYNGLTYFTPSQLLPQKRTLQPLLAGVRINENDSLYRMNGRALHLKAWQNSVEIQFVAPYFRNPQKVRYRYRLTGLDTGWVENGRNGSVRFSSLEPGDYTFTAAASLDGHTWSETKRPLRFLIASPFWKQGWFIILFILGLVGMAFWLIHQRDLRLKRQALLKQQIAEIEMKALRAQMNPHFIFNCLNSINRYIVKSDNATASLYLTRFAKLIRLILDNSNSSRVLLSNELEALKLYVEMEALRFDHKFSSQLYVADDVYADSIEVPSLIIQPYVENAIWHGLMHKETGGHLSIRVSMDSESLLHCEVEDNGIGRQKSQAFKSKSATHKKSLGMKLTEDRLGILNQYASLNASVDIIDLHNEHQEATGTKVIIKIPV